MKKIITLSFLILSSQLAISQDNSISGTVKDQEGEVLPFTVVALLNSPDSSSVHGTVADEDGHFKLDDVKDGKYILRAIMVGYDDYFSIVEISGANVQTTIIMSPGSEELKEIIVKGRRNRIQTDLGKTIVNVSKEMKMGKNLLDLLKDVPGVMVAPDGAVSIEGKSGITILIDDKPVHFTGRSLTEYLKSVDAGKVDKIELMTNPSAKYDAAGNSGILAVKLTEKKDNGLYGSMNGNYTQSRYPFYSLNGSLNYRKEKLGLHITPSHYKGQGFLIPQVTTTAVDRSTGEVSTVLEETGFWLEEFSDYALDMGADYDFSSATTAGISVKGVYHPNDEVDNIETTVTNVHAGTEYVNLTRRERGFRRNNVQANFFLKHEADSTQSIIVNADHFREDKDVYQRVTSTDHDVNGVPEPEPLMIRNDMPVQSTISGIKVDYEKNGDIGKVEAGVKASYVTVEDPNRFEVYTNKGWANDTGRTNYYSYDENINAAYVSGSAKKGKWQARAGVRVEHTYAKGQEEITDEVFERNYTSVFPTAYASYKANDMHTFEVNYGKRIQRPYYREMNPFTLIKSSYSSSTGNPYLLPMFTHNVELKHNYRGKFITTFSHSVSNNVFVGDIRFDRASNMSYYSTTNNGRKVRSALSAYCNQQINNWWGATVNARGFYITYDGEIRGEQVHNEGYGAFFRVDTQFTFRDTWFAQLSAWYSTPFTSSPVESTGQSLYTSAEVSKSVLNDTGTLRLSITDPFGMYSYEQTTMIEGTTTVSSPIMNVRNITLGFNYNFGNKEKQARRRDRLEEAERI